MPDYDVAVIGAGAAGLSVSGVAAQLGLRTALIERDRMGGDCLNAGCVPSKALLAASHAAQTARAAFRYGVFLPEARIEWAAVQAHVKGVIEGIAPLDSEARYRELGAHVVRGEARFAAPGTLAIRLPGGERRITARRIVVAAGSRAAVPRLPGLDTVSYLTNATLFDVPDQPAHLLILGGGSIGLEMAQAHAALGSRVTMVESHRLAGREDPELAEIVRQELLRNGVTVLEGTAVAAVEPGPTLVLADGRRVTGSHLLVAVGRTPNLDGLALDDGHVAVTERGVAVDAGLRSTSNKRVYAVGDIADPVGLGPRYLTHVGSYHAGLVVRGAMFRLPARLDYAALPRVTYTDPELAQVGLTEAEAHAAGLAVDILRWRLDENDRARTERRTEGLVKLVVGKRGRVLGAGIAAPHAGEMIGAWTLAITRRVPLSAMANMIVPYPTRAEAAKRAAGSLLLPRLFAPRVQWVVRQIARFG